MRRGWNPFRKSAARALLAPTRIVERSGARRVRLNKKPQKRSTMPECYCCSCEKLPSPDGVVFPIKIDQACRNHGAHGARECRKHKMPAVPCQWNDGCGMTIDKLIEIEH